MPKIRQWIEGRLEGAVLNLFGGVVRLTHPEGGSIHTNDINPDFAADTHLDAFDLASWTGYQGRFAVVVSDPPYSAHQAVVSYGIKKAQQITHARDVIEYVLAPGGRVISLGFNSTGMSASRGFEKEAFAAVNCGASHNDIILLSERHVHVTV